MSRWQYALMFPQTPGTLRPAQAVRDLCWTGAEVDGVIRTCIDIDGQGHLLDVGEEISLNRPFDRDLSNRLERGDSFSVAIRTQELLVSVEFRLGKRNPHISFGWSLNLYESASLCAKELLWGGLLGFADDSEVAYVVLVDDAPVHFEDRFIDIDGRRHVDLAGADREGFVIREVWVHSNRNAALPVGLSYSEAVDIGRQYIRHTVLSVK